MVTSESGIQVGDRIDVLVSSNAAHRSADSYADAARLEIEVAVSR